MQLTFPNVLALSSGTQRIGLLIPRVLHIHFPHTFSGKLNSSSYLKGLKTEGSYRFYCTQYVALYESQRPVLLLDQWLFCNVDSLKSRKIAIVSQRRLYLRRETQCTYFPLWILATGQKLTWRMGGQGAGEDHKVQTNIGWDKKQLGILGTWGH